MKYFLFLIAVSAGPDGELIHTKYQYEVNSSAECEALRHQYEFTYTDIGVIVGSYCETGA